MNPAFGSTLKPINARRSIGGAALMYESLEITLSISPNRPMVLSHKEDAPNTSNSTASSDAT